MPSRQPFRLVDKRLVGHRPVVLPRRWLMTDERMGDVIAAVAALPAESGVIFRHYATAPSARRALFGEIKRAVNAQGCRHQRPLLFLADTPHKARRWGADGVHLHGGSPLAVSKARTAARLGLLVSQSVHDASEMLRANRAAALAIVSPVYPTRSHPDGAVLSEDGFATLAAQARVPVVALGGMNAECFVHLSTRGAYGWAAIDALTPSHR